jgi:hypothetical protein
VSPRRADREAPTSDEWVATTGDPDGDAEYVQWLTDPDNTQIISTNDSALLLTTMPSHSLMTIHTHSTMVGSRTSATLTMKLSLCSSGVVPSLHWDVSQTPY